MWGAGVERRHGHLDHLHARLRGKHGGVQRQVIERLVVDIEVVEPPQVLGSLRSTVAYVASAAYDSDDVPAPSLTSRTQLLSVGQLKTRK